MDGWIEAWLLKRDEPLCDIGELYAERRKRSRLRAHLWLMGQAWDLARNGMALAALRTRGPVVRDSGLTKGGGGMRWLTEVRLAARGLVRSKGWSLAALTTLALGMGAATGLFSAAYSVLARPLPYPDPGQLVRVYPENPRSGSRASFSMPDWEDWSTRSRQLESLGLFSTLPSDLVLTGHGDAVELETAYVSSGFFEALGIPAALGRVLRPEEERGDNHVVVLSHGVWQRLFGGDPGVVGSTVMLKAEPYRVVGVMPPGFGFPTEDVELYTFLTVIPPTSTPLHLRVVRFLDAVGRMAPGASHDQVEGELSSIAGALAEAYPDTNQSLTGAVVVPLREALVSDIRPALIVLMAGAGLFLLAALANVSGLVLVRQLARASEFAVRASLGAGKRQLTRQTLVETAVLVALGTVGGVLVASGVTRGLTALAGDALPRASEIVIDAPVLLFAGGLAVVATVLATLLPARFLSRMGPSALRTGAGNAPARPFARSLLVACQVGLATVVLVVAGLMVRSLQEMSRVDAGFDPSGRLVASLNISSTLYPNRPDYLGFYHAYRDELAAIPGVEAVGSIRYFPTRGVGESYNWQVPGIQPPAGESPSAYMLQIDAGLPEALGMRVLDGRMLSDEVFEEAPEIVVNRTLARQAFGEESPVGRTLLLDDDYPVQVVGVVDDVRQRGLGVDPDPTFYIGQAANPRRSMALVIRTSGDPLALSGAVRDRLRQLDEDQPLAELTTAEELLSGSLARPRLLAAITGAFGVLSTLLALVAVGGAVAHAVTRRTREIGIRVALGERPGSVSVRMIRKALRPVALGLVGGVVVTLALGRFLRGVLFGIAPYDWSALGTGLGVLLLASVVACLIPARRALSVDPVSAMRAQ